MTVVTSQTTHETCALYTRAIAGGEESRDVITHLSEMYGVQRPAIWKRLRAGGVLPGYGLQVIDRRVGRAAAGVSRHKTLDRYAVLPPKISRDPCPRCGVRGDIPCGHSRNRLGMIL